MKKKSYKKKTKIVTLTGKLTLVGQTLAGVPIDIRRWDNGKLVKTAKTNKKGIYTAKAKLTKTTTLIAVLFASQSSCDATPPSPAPAGCASETTTLVLGKPVKVVPK